MDDRDPRRRLGARIGADALAGARGFLTDILGLLFLLPPTRAVIRRLFLRQAMRRITVTMAGPRMPRDGSRRDDDVEGTAVDADARTGLGR